MKSRIKSGSDVVVISGDDKGKSGKVLKVLHKKNRVVVDGIAIGKCCVRKSQQYPDGSIIEKPMPVHISNVMPKEKFDSRDGRRKG